MRKNFKSLAASAVLIAVVGAVLIALVPTLVSQLAPTQAQNVYLPQPGAIRVFKGDWIGVDFTGCGGTSGGILIPYRFLPLGANRPQDFTVAMTPPTGACPAGQAFTNGVIPLDDGWLEAVGTINNSAQNEAQMWIQGFVGRGLQNFGGTQGSNAVNAYPLYLFSCAPGQFQQCAWALGSSTGSQAQDTTLLGQNLGANTNQTVTNPAAGANFSTTLVQNTNLLYNVQNIRFTLVTSAAAANRIVCIQFQSPAAGPIWLSSCSASAQVASSTVNYNFSIATGPTPVVTIVAGANNPDINGSLPALVQIDDNSSIASVILNLQAGDQISNIVIRTQFANYRD